MSQILRDGSGKTIAEIRQQGASLVIFDASGKTLGFLTLPIGNEFKHRNIN